MSIFHPQKTTLHGYYEPIKEGLKIPVSRPGSVPAPKTTDGPEYRKSGERIGGETYHFYDVYHNPIVNTYNEDSYDCFQSMRTKGVRNLRGPTDVYRKPITTSQDVGFLIKDSPLERQPWAKLDRRFPRVFSDMSRLVSSARRKDLLFYFF